jgi:hypothetical protein
MVLEARVNVCFVSQTTPKAMISTRVLRCSWVGLPPLCVSIMGYGGINLFFIFPFLADVLQWTST